MASFLIRGRGTSGSSGDSWGLGTQQLRIGGFGVVF